MIRSLSGKDLAHDRLHTIKIIGFEALTGFANCSADRKAGLAFTAPLNQPAAQNLVMKSLNARTGRQTVRDAPGSGKLHPLLSFPFDNQSAHINR